MKKVSSEGNLAVSKQRNMLLILTPLCCSRGPIRVLPEFLVWLLVNFYMLRKDKNPCWNQIYGTQCGAVVLFQEDHLGTSKTTEFSFPVCDKWVSELLVSASLHLISAFLASGSHSTIIQAMLSPNLPFPSPDISLLLLSVSSPTSVLFFWESGHNAATASLLSTCEAMLPLMSSGLP